MPHQEISKKTFIPEIVDDTGKPLVGPDIDAVLKRVTELAEVANLARIRKSLERQEFKGIADPRVLNATDQMQYVDLLQLAPAAWISCFIINRGPDMVHIQVNYPFRQASLNIAPKETRTIDYSHADRRIELLYYQCDPGGTALVEVEGVC